MRPKATVRLVVCLAMAAAGLGILAGIGNANHNCQTLGSSDVPPEVPAPGGGGSLSVCAQDSGDDGDRHHNQVARVSGENHGQSPDGSFEGNSSGAAGHTSERWQEEDGEHSRGWVGVDTSGYGKFGGFGGESGGSAGLQQQTAGGQCEQTVEAHGFLGPFELADESHPVGDCTVDLTELGEE